VFKIYSHIATFPSRVATALMQLTDNYPPFQLGRISRRQARNAVHCTLPFAAAAAAWALHVILYIRV
jgi:hypothetical protein